METIYLLMVLLSFVSIFYGTRKKMGYITLVEVLICAIVAVIPMINLVIAFYVLAEAGVFRNKL
jgi:hypothetical protein